MRIISARNYGTIMNALTWFVHPDPRIPLSNELLYWMCLEDQRVPL